MKKHFFAYSTVLCLLFALVAKSQTFKPVVPPAEILKNMNSLLAYYDEHLQLTGNFLAYDTKGHAITAAQLLKQTSDGGYLPLQIEAKPGVWAFQLYKLPANTIDDVSAFLKQIGRTEYGIFQIVGKPFPPYHYVDLNGHVYTPASTKGKIVVLKAWAISCVPCVEEFPELNKLVEKYKNRKDIVFVSIAPDPRPKLRSFMKRHPFDYAVVPISEKYIVDTLRAWGYPAHWVINKQGIVVSMSYDKSVMIAALEKEIAKK
jgi:peroxiredoxin